MDELDAVVVDRVALDPAITEEMFRLYHLYFEATSRELFLQDLGEKDWVILMRDGEGVLRGFSTLAMGSFVLQGFRGRYLFSGDTIIDRESWGTQCLSRAFIAHAGRLKERFPEDPLYWLLISKGYRTYRYLPVCFREFHPRFDKPTPPALRAILNHLASLKFGDAYDPERGVVHFASSRGQLREAWAEIPEAMLKKPEVRFFLERNAGYREGDELVCLTEISAENIRGFGRGTYLEAIRHETVDA